MNHFRQKYIGLLILVFAGLIFVSSCEMQADSEILNNDLTESFDNSLAESLSMMSDDPQGAITYLDKVISQAKDASSSYYIGKATWYQAYIYKKKLDNISKAYFGYNEALKYLEGSDDFTLKAKISNNLAILNQYYEHHDAAIDIYLGVLEYQDELEDEFISDLYFNLGRSYKLLRTEESLDKAEEAFTRSMEVARSVDYHENIASVNNQVGTMYKDLKNYEIARIAYQNTIRTYQNGAEGSELLDYVGKAYHGIGVTYMEEGNHQEAISAFKTALEYEQYSDTKFITKFDLGTVLNDVGNQKEAIATWKNALTEKHNVNDRVHIEIYARLTSTLAFNEEYEEAVKYAQVYNEHIGNILSVGESYETKNNKVLFADIVREYAEFNQVIPFYKEPWAIALMFLFIAVAVYAGSHAYYQSKLSTKVSDTRSEIQIEFQNIKID